VGVAIPDRGHAVRRGKRPDPLVDEAPERRGVERFQGVGPDAGIARVQESPQRPTLRTERVGEERVGRDRDAALLVDLADRRPHRA